MGWRKLNQVAAAKLLDCSPSSISRIWNELEIPQTKLASAIEEATKDSPVGAIAPRDWIVWAERGGSHGSGSITSEAS